MNDVQSLRDRIDYLEEEIRQLREKIAPEDNPFLGKLGMTRQLAAVLFCLYRHQLVTFSMIEAVTEKYSRDIFDRKDDEDHVSCRSRVAIWKVRRRLEKHGITFKTVWGIGYEMEPKDKAKLIALMENKDD